MPIAARTKLEDLPLAIAVQAIEELKSFNLPDDVQNVIQGQITDLNDTHSIYSLLHKRGIMTKNHFQSGNFELGMIFGNK